MKPIKVIFLFFITMSLQNCCPFLSDCDSGDDDIFIEPDFSLYEPVLLHRENFENSVLLKDPIAIINSGKIYIKSNLLFINEVNKGFHIYNNVDPENPIPIKFLEAPGATDLAIRENVIYINQATDLIAILYDSQNNEITLKKRIPNIFPILWSPDGYYPNDLTDADIVIDWKLKN